MKYAVACGADGGMTMCTPCDPLFVALPLLAAARQEVISTSVAARHCLDL